MPTYDYQCRSCNRVTEVIHAMTADGPTVCEHCGGALRRVLYPAGIIFKGSGFYRTDSRGSSEPPASTTRKSEPKPSSGGSDGGPGSSSPEKKATAADGAAGSSS